MLKVILVASGKGGTGKTSFTAGVGAALAQIGHRVLLIDGDCGLRNLDIVLGMSDRVVYSFADVAGGAVPLGDAMARHPEYQSLYLLTAPVALPALSERGMEQLAVQAEEAAFDYLLVDGRCRAACRAFFSGAYCDAGGCCYVNRPCLHPRGGAVCAQAGRGILYPAHSHGAQSGASAAYLPRQVGQYRRRDG